MRKPLSLLFACSLFLISCNKRLEEFRLNPGLDLRFCNIKTWTHPHLGELRTSIFHYNAQGNPISVTSNLEGTGNGYHYFRYDNQHRLAEYEWEFAYTYYYHYDGNSRRPLGDTRIDAYGREYEEIFTYDEKGRITKVVSLFVSTPFEDEENANEETDYYYEGENLVRVVANGHDQLFDVEYTSKPSIYLTNKVWMLVSRNYSRNAPAGAASFNSKGLPLTYPAEPARQFYFLDMGYEDAVITYQCE